MTRARTHAYEAHTVATLLAVLAAAHARMDVLGYPPRNLTPPIDDRPREPSAA